MANWLMELTKLSKTDETALELLRQLKGAKTQEEKEKAKENGKEYIQKTQKTEQEPEQPTNTNETPTTTTETTEEDIVEEDKNDVCVDNPAPVVKKKEVEAKYDMSEPAFNPRLAKMGITREEELFQQNVYVRKLSRQEKIEIRRSIYQKKKGYMKNIQEKFKKERAEKIAKLQADPEYQKYLHQQKLVIRIVEALKSHCNIDWMFKNIEGLNEDVMRELLKKPENVNKFKEQKAEFVKNFYKRFGE